LVVAALSEPETLGLPTGDSGVQTPEALCLGPETSGTSGADPAEAYLDERPHRELQRSRLFSDVFEGYQRRGEAGDCDEIGSSSSHAKGGVGGNFDLPASGTGNAGESDVVPARDVHGSQAACIAIC
jgi:hypothetical protein